MLNLICKTLAICSIAINSIILLGVLAICASSLLAGLLLGSKGGAVVTLAAIVECIAPLCGLILGNIYLSHPRFRWAAVVAGLVSFLFICFLLNGGIDFAIALLDA